MLNCQHFTSARCRSCSLLSLSHDEVVSQKQRWLSELFPEADHLPLVECQQPNGSRIRAKLAITGTATEPVIGFFDQARTLVPVDDCPLHHPLITNWMTSLRQFITDAHLVPYDPETDRGELKFVVLTASPSHNTLMVQWVLRSKESVDRIRREWKRLSADKECPVSVMSINIQPLRSSQIQGEVELPVSDNTTLPVTYGAVTLHYESGGFIQTNHEIATRLYATAAEWLQASDSGGNAVKDSVVDLARDPMTIVDERNSGEFHYSSEPRKFAAENAPQRRSGGILDLYCGSGAFALTAAMQGVTSLTANEQREGPPGNEPAGSVGSRDLHPLLGNAVKDSVVDLARDPRTCVDEGNSGEFHYSSEPPKFAAESPSQSCLLGIDVSPSSIRCANLAASESGAKAEFRCVSLQTISPQFCADLKAQWPFDTVICNPPRRGLDGPGLELIRSLDVPQILYSSCDPKTLHRDCQLLSDRWKVVRVQGFDMFPFTPHMEVLCLLRQR